MNLFFIILFLLCIFNRFIKQKKTVFFVFLIIAFIIGFRGIEVGTDTKAFKQIYESFADGRYYGYPEPLYAYMNIWANRLGFTYSTFLFVLALIFGGCCATAISISSPKRGFSVFTIYGLYMVMYSMNITRQMTAVSIVFLAYALISRGKSIWGFFLILLASQIHSSAIIALICLFLKYINLSKRRFIIVSVFVSIILGLMLSDTTIMSLTDRFSGDYGEYLHQTNTRNSFRSGERILQGGMLAVYWSSLFLVIYNYIKQTYLNSFWMKLYYVAIICINLTMRLELGLRIVLYFSIAESICFAIFICHNNLKLKETARIVISVYLIVFFSIFLLNNSADVLPYSNILFK